MLILAHPAYLRPASCPIGLTGKRPRLRCRLAGGVQDLRSCDCARGCKGLLSDIYSTHSLRVSSSDVGFTKIARPRLYILLLRKGHVHLAVDLRETYDHVKADFKARVGRPNAAAAFMASAEECLAAENDLRRRRGLEPAAMSASDWTYLFLSWSQSLHFLLQVAIVVITE